MHMGVPHDHFQFFFGNSLGSMGTDLPTTKHHQGTMAEHMEKW